MTWVPKTLANAAWVTGGSYVMYAAMFIASVLINRSYGTAELGRFGLAWAVAQLTVQAATSGFGGIHKREVAYGLQPIRNLVAETLAVRLASIAIIIVLFGIVLLALRLPRPVALAISLMVIGKSIEAIGLVFAETLQASGGNKIFGILSAVNATLLLGGVGLVWHMELGSDSLYLATACSSVGFTLVALLAFARVHGAPHISATMARIRDLCSQSWPLIANAVVYVLAGRSAIILVAAFAGETQAGIFAFASGVVGGLAVVAGAIGTVVFPQLCKLFVDEPGALRRRMYSLFKWMSVLGLFSFVFLIFARDELVSLYGDLPRDASNVLVVLGAGLVPTFAAVTANYMFTAIGRQKDGLYVATINAVLVVALVTVLTHWYAALGAAVGVALSQFFVCVMSVVWLDKRYLRDLERSGRGKPVRNDGPADA